MKIHIYLVCLLLLLSCNPVPKGGNTRQNSRSSTSIHTVNKPTKNTTNKTSAKSGETKKKLTSKELYKKCNPAVFTVLTTSGSQGSGFFISSKGLAVSNFHVFEGSNPIEDIIITSDNARYGILETIEYDAAEDFILFRVDLNGERKPYLPITQRKPVIGSHIYAIGSPLNLSNTFSEGLISQLRENGKIIQINAPIDHGSSGGALINEYGEVIGITSSGIDRSGANLNFAINIDVIKPYLPESMKKKSKHTPYNSKKR